MAGLVTTGPSGGRMHREATSVVCDAVEDAGEESRGILCEACSLPRSWASIDSATR